MNRKKHNISRIILGLFAMLGILMMLVKPSVSQAQEKGAYDVYEKEIQEKEAVILFTNDVHCAIEGYPKLAAYKAQLEEEGKNVVVVDAGDAIQGEAIGAQTKGSAIIDIMNETGYSYAVPGNHEFDYGVDNLLKLAASDSSKFEYLSSTFVDLRTNKTVFKPYDIAQINGMRIAFVGISTPESYIKSTPTYFQDSDGNLIYGFSQDDLYKTVQNAVDSARSEGVDKVVAIGHLGINGTTDGWKSTDVIANTSGIDVLIDAHSHEVIDGQTYKNNQGENVLLASTGTKFKYIGQLELKSDGTQQIELISPETIDVNSSDYVKAAYERVQKKVDDYNSQIEYLYEKIGTSEIELTTNDSDSGKRVIRNKETNLGDYVSDAYRIVTGADISLVNAGSMRSSIMNGDITRKSFVDVSPWHNKLCVIKATGQQILDALEHGARNLPQECGGFLHTSGLTYEIHAYIDSPVVLDENGSFKAVDETKERRVSNVKVNGIAIDPDKEYKVASTFYILKNGGDGFTMFKNAEIVKQEDIPDDSEILFKYFTDNLDSVISKEKYGNPYGDGRIKIYDNKEDVPGRTEESVDAGADTDNVNDNTGNADFKEDDNEEIIEAKSPKTADENRSELLLLLALTASMVCMYSCNADRKIRENKE